MTRGVGTEPISHTDVCEGYAISVVCEITVAVISESNDDGELRVKSPEIYWA